MTSRTQSLDELLKHLIEQIGFLERSSASYDAGFEDEAKRIAVVIRVLVHDTASSTSLLKLLNKKNIKFYNSSLSYHPNPLPFAGLVMMRVQGGEGDYVAPLDDGPPTRSRTHKLAFNIWWQGMFVIKDTNQKTFTRKDLVLNVADTDGGAHIDPKLNEYYDKLSRFNSLGWKIFNEGEGKDFKNNPILPSIRQISHELIKTLKEELP